MSNQKVQIGDKVLVVINKEVRELEIVNVPQGDLQKKKISFLTPIAQAVLGKRPPLTVTVQLPNGNTMDCQLLQVHHH